MHVDNKRKKSEFKKKNDKRSGISDIEMVLLPIHSLTKKKKKKLLETYEPQCVSQSHPIHTLTNIFGSCLLT